MMLVLILSGLFAVAVVTTVGVYFSVNSPKEKYYTKAKSMLKKAKTELRKEYGMVEFGTTDGYERSFVKYNYDNNEGEIFVETYDRDEEKEGIIILSVEDKDGKIKSYVMANQLFSDDKSGRTTRKLHERTFLQICNYLECFENVA